MIAKILISSLLEKRIEEIDKILQENNFKNPHPDLLYLGDEEKLGVEEAKKIRQFLTLKPYQAKGRIVVIISSQNLTPDAQNALLKTLEELHEETLFILGADSEHNLLPTILSRCQITQVTGDRLPVTDFEEIEKLINSNLQQRFEFIEKTDDKEGLLKALVAYFHKQGQENHSLVEFNKKLIQAEQWSRANVNIRAILEYLMLELPTL